MWVELSTYEQTKGSIHDAEDRAVRIRNFHFPIVGQAELIVYRDNTSFESWQSEGATADNQEAMIHVVVSGDSVTLVVDRVDSPLAELARELLESLRPNRIVLRTAA